MGGLYYNIWSCSNCDYTSKSVAGPFIVKPKPGTPKAGVEHRWCNDCQEIQRTFTGKGVKFALGEEPNSKIWHPQFESLQDLNRAIKELEMKKKSNLFFFLTGESKQLIEYRKLAVAYAESESICDRLTRESIGFYNKHEPEPRCLICNGTSVSSVSFDQDVHTCGGRFIREGSGRVGSVGRMQVITYSGDGTSTSKMKSTRF